MSKSLDELPRALDSAQDASLRGYVRAAAAVFVKDARAEMRGRHALTAVVLFAITSTIAVSFVLSDWGSSPAVASALLWLIIYFSAMTGLSRSFVREEEIGTASLLRLAARPNSVYLGKLMSNVALLLVHHERKLRRGEPLFVVLMSVRVAEPELLCAALAIGSLALSAGATMTAAMVSRASAKGTLFAAISLPLLIPVLVASIQVTDTAFSGERIAQAAAHLRLLIYYCGAVIPASLMLFRHIWED